MGARGRDPGEIDAGLCGEAARERGHLGAAVDPRRAIVARGRTHLEERIERDRSGRSRVRLGLRRREGRHAGHALQQRALRRSRRNRRRRRLLRRRRSRDRSRAGDDRDHGPDRRHLALRDADFREHAGRRRRHLHRHLVGLDLEQVVAGLDGVARHLEPLGDLALGDGLAELRHQHVHRMRPPTTSPRRIAFREIPSAPRARPRGRCLTASYRRTAPQDRRRARG